MMLHRTAPLLLSLGLYLGFAAYNSVHVTTDEIMLWAGAALLLGILVSVIALLLSKNETTRLLIGCILVLSFYSYGHVYSATPDTAKPFVLVAYAATPILLIVLLRRRITNSSWKLPLTAFVLASLAYPLVSFAVTPSVAVAVSEDIGAVPLSTFNRDIYIVVLDRYARADILKQYFDYDNSSFLTSLKSKGFRIADGSRANYAETSHSLASMLNMQYLDDLLPTIDKEEQSRVPLYDLVTNNRVKDMIGNQWLTVGSWWQPTRSSDEILSEFGVTLLSSTALLPLVYLWDYKEIVKLKKAVKTESGDFPIYTPGWSATLLQYQFSKLRKLAKEPSGRLFLAHIASPHPPYVYNANGGPVNRALSARGQYVEQLQYTNKLVLEWLTVVAKYSPDAVIVMMSDEGPKIDDDRQLSGTRVEARIFDGMNQEERLEAHSAILMAVRGFSVYPTITPINVMRILSDLYLGTALGPLEDRNYMIPDSDYPYRWAEYP